MALRPDFAAHLAQLGAKGADRATAPLPVYALIGRSTQLRDEALLALRQQLLGRPTAAPGEGFRVGEGAAVDEAVMAAQSLPLWGTTGAGPTFVVLQGVGALSAADAERLRRYVERPAPHSVLCLLGDRLDGRGQLSKVLVRQHAGFELLPPRAGELPAWLRRRARAAQLDLDDAAARLLLDYVGADVDLLLQALDKVALYVGDEGPLHVAAIQAALSRTREESIFAFTDALGSRNFATAIAKLHHLLQEGQSPLLVLAMIGRQLRQLLQVDQAGPRRAKGELAVRLGVAPFVVDRLLQQAARFNTADLLAALQAAAAADRQLKSSRLSPALILAGVVEKVCVGKACPPAPT